MYECAFTSKNGLADDSRRFIHAICKGRNDDAASSVDFVSRRRVKCESSITRRSMFCSMVIFFQDSSLQNVDKDRSSRIKIFYIIVTTFNNLIK